MLAGGQLQGVSKDTLVDVLEQLLPVVGEGLVVLGKLIDLVGGVSSQFSAAQFVQRTRCVLRQEADPSIDVVQLFLVALVEFGITALVVEGAKTVEKILSQQPVALEPGGGLVGVGLLQ